MFDFRVFEHDAFFHPYPGADDRTRTDGDVGAEFGRGVDFCSGVDEDRRDEVGGGFGEFCALALKSFLQVQRICGDSRSRGFDLAPKILGFEDVELFAVGEVAEDILFETQDLVFFAVFELFGEEGGVEVFGGGVGDHAGAVGAPFYGAFDGGEDCFGGEEVDAAVDEVGDVAFWFLDVVQHAFRMRI